MVRTGYWSGVVIVALGLSSRPLGAQETPPVPEAARPKPIASMLANQPPAAQPAVDPWLTPASARRQETVAEAASARIAPALEIEMVGPEETVAGQPVELTLVVRNTGRVPAFDVRVEEELSAGCHYLGGEPSAEQPGERLVWRLGILDPGARRAIVVRVRPGSESVMRSQARVSFAVTAAVRTKVVSPRLGVDVVAAEQATRGERVPVTIRLTNTGTGPTEELRLRARLPEGLTHPQGNFIEAELPGLAVGASREIQLTVVASKPGPSKIEITAQAGEGAIETALAMVRVTEPALEIRQSGPTSLTLGKEAELIAEVSNPGSTPTEPVQVTMSLPAGLEFAGATAGGVHDPAARLVVWHLDELPPGPPVRLTVQARASAVGMVRSRTLARSGDLQATSEAQVRVEGMPEAALEVVDFDDPIQVGAETHYEIRVANIGDIPLTQVRIQAEVPECLELRAVGGPVPYRPEVGSLEFEPLGSLAVQADAIYRVRVRALTAGTARFKVRLRCAELPEPIQQEQTTRILGP